MTSKSVVAVTVFAALVLLGAPTTVSSKEPTGTCAAKKPEKVRSTTPPPQSRDNRRVPIFSPPKTLKGKPMW
jgi:hypothetical protein